MGHLLMFVMGGTPPGMLFLVCWECVCLVNFRACLVVGLGAAMMGGTSVILVSIGGSTLLSAMCWSSQLITLCFTLCPGRGT
jgi:hypothetical protein